MKKGVVCKIFKETESQEPRQVIYIPTLLLIPTIIYIHKHFLHPSRSQTYKQFIETYYHPQARKAIQRICKACIVCSATRNVEYKNIPVWRTASLRSAPHQQTPDPVYIVVDKLVHCDPNMYS